MGQPTSNSYVECLLERGISFSSTSRTAQGENDHPLNLIKQLSPITLEGSVKLLGKKVMKALYIKALQSWPLSP